MMTNICFYALCTYFFDAARLIEFAKIACKTGMDERTAGKGLYSSSDEGPLVET